MDTWELEQISADASNGDWHKKSARLINLYRGHFLDRDEETPWMLAPRERFRTIFLRAVEVLGALAEAEGDWIAAEQLYRSGIAVDLLAESLYRHLMLCCHKLGRRAEAIEVYRRCRQVLSVTLGIAPSVETEGVRRTVG